MDRVTREVRLMTDELYRSSGVHLTALALRAGPRGLWQSGTMAADVGNGLVYTAPTDSTASTAVPNAEGVPRGSRERRVRVDVGNRERERGRGRGRNGSDIRSRSPHRTAPSGHGARGGWQQLRMWSEENWEHIQDLRDLHDVIDRRLERVLRHRDRQEHYFSSRGRDRRGRSHNLRLRDRSSSRDDRHHRNTTRHRSRERSRSRERRRHRYRRRNRSSNRETDRSHQDSYRRSASTHCRCEEPAENPTVGNPASAEVSEQGPPEPIMLRDDEGALPDYPLPVSPPPVSPPNTIDVVANVETQSADSGSIHSN